MSHRRIPIRTAGFVLLLGASLACGRRVPPPSEPDILLIVIDSLRADHLGAYGYQKGTSPNIDRFARDAVVFDRAITQGAWTRPAMASLLTSLNSNAHGATMMGRTIPPEAVTLPEELQRQGYATVAIQTNPTVTASKNFSQGFDTYIERIGGSAPRVLDRFSRWLESRQPRKFFAYLHFMDVHLPYDPPEPYLGRFTKGYRGRFDRKEVRSRDQVLDVLDELSDADRRHVTDLYDACIAYVDDYVGRVFDGLRRRGRLDNTIVIVTSDHGEELFDRGWFEHGHSMSRELARVPLIIRHPRLAKGGVRVKQLVRLIDLFPTVMAFIGLQSPGFVMGRDLGPAIADPEADWELAAVTEGVLYGPAQLAIEAGPYKFVQISRPLHRRDDALWKHLSRGLSPDDEGVTLFFDLRKDPDERHPLVDHPLEERWARLLDEQRELDESQTLTASDEVNDDIQREQLRSLGYVQ